MNDSKALDGITGDEYDGEINDLQRVNSLADQVSEKVRDLVKDLSNTDLTLEPLVNITKGISNEVHSLVPITNGSNENKEKISDELYAKWEKTRIQHEQDQAEIEQLKNQISSASNFCSKVGAILGNLVWRASHEQEMVNIWLSEHKSVKKLEGMLTIIDTVIVSFFGIYQDVLPPTNTYEHEFPMGLLGTVSNISAIPTGRQFVIDNPDGKSLLKNLVKFFPLIPTNSDDRLKKLILIILWNMCVNKNGLRYLIGAQVDQVVLHCLAERNAVKMQALGLQLLQSIALVPTESALDPVESALVDRLLKRVPIATIQSLASSERDIKIAKSAQEMLEYLKDRRIIDAGTQKRSIDS